MNGLSLLRRFDFVAGLAAIFLIVFLAGCKDTSTNNVQKQAANSGDTKSAPLQDRRTAREIVSGVLNRYAFAKTYRDQAVLYLNYRIEGRAIQEPQPWSVRLSPGHGRNPGR